MTPDNENTSSDVSVCFKWQEKHVGNGSLPCAATLPNNDIKDLFKRVEKRKEKKLQVQVNDNLIKGNSNINLTD